MIHLKLYGLPRTGTNALAHNIEMTWPGIVRVWHDGSPSGDEAWKHGWPERVGGVDGYLLCHKPQGAWRQSMARYNHKHMITDDRLLAFVWEGWMAIADLFEYEDTYSVLQAASKGQMLFTLKGIEDRFGLPAPAVYYVEPKVLRRNGDVVPVGDRTLPQPYEWPSAG